MLRPVAALLVAVWLAMAPVVMADPGDVVAAARSRIGSPYAWGAAGPDRFDCSGLVVWAYRQSGITVPRTSQGQAAGGTAVGRSELQPGDVVIYYPDASHVGIYVGGGQVIHASTVGRPVAEVPIDSAGPFRNARRYLRKADPMKPGPWTGDPTWLEEVLRDALGDRLVVHPGWETRGTGNGENGTSEMGPLWGVMIHHTGNSRERPEVIRDGVWQSPTYFLPGPLSQCLITPDGKCHLVAIGPCNHAGSGSYPGVPAGTGNTRLVGFECAWPTIRPDGSYDKSERWPDAQIATMRDASAAVVRRLGQRGDRVIGHKDYAGASQGKWDPGNLDMPWFRGEVNKALDGEFTTPATSPTDPTTPSEGGFLMALSDVEQQELLTNSRDAVKLAREARDHAKWVRDQLGPNLWGPESSMGKNAKGEELTVRDGLAQHIRKDSN